MIALNAPVNCLAYHTHTRVYVRITHIAATAGWCAAAVSNKSVNDPHIVRA